MNTYKVKTAQGNIVEVRAIGPKRAEKIAARYLSLPGALLPSEEKDGKVRCLHCGNKPAHPWHPSFCKQNCAALYAVDNLL